MTSYNNSSKLLAVYLEWELQGGGGNPLDKAGRKAAFISWVERMMVKIFKNGRWSR